MNIGQPGVSVFRRFTPSPTGLAFVTFDGTVVPCGGWVLSSHFTTSLDSKLLSMSRINYLKKDTSAIS